MSGHEPTFAVAEFLPSATYRKPSWMKPQFPTFPHRKASDQWLVNARRNAQAVIAAKARQKGLDGYYNMERMLKRVSVGMMQLSSAVRTAARWANWPLSLSRPTRFWSSRARAKSL
jgi:hypothetical protein